MEVMIINTRKMKIQAIRVADKAGCTARTMKVTRATPVTP